MHDWFWAILMRLWRVATNGVVIHDDRLSQWQLLEGQRQGFDLWDLGLLWPKYTWCNN